MSIWQLCANLLIPNCLRSNLSYSPLAASELYVINDKVNFLNLQSEELSAKEKCFIKGGTNSVSCHATGCNATNPNVMANRVLANLRGQNPPPCPPRPSEPTLPG